MDYFEDRVKKPGFEFVTGSGSGDSMHSFDHEAFDRNFANALSAKYAMKQQELDLNKQMHGPGGVQERIAQMHYGFGDYAGKTLGDRQIASSERVAEMQWGPQGAHMQQIAIMKPFYQSLANLHNVNARVTGERAAYDEIMRNRFDLPKQEAALTEFLARNKAALGMLPFYSQAKESEYRTLADLWGKNPYGMVAMKYGYNFGNAAFPNNLASNEGASNPGSNPPTKSKYAELRKTYNLGDQYTDEDIDNILRMRGAQLPY